MALYEVAFESALLALEACRADQLVFFLFVVLVPEFDSVGVLGLFFQVERLAPLREMPALVVDLRDMLFLAVVNDEIRLGLVNVLIAIYFNGLDQQLDPIHRRSRITFPLTLKTAIMRDPAASHPITDTALPKRTAKLHTINQTITRIKLRRHIKPIARNLP